MRMLIVFMMCAGCGGVAVERFELNQESPMGWTFERRALVAASEADVSLHVVGCRGAFTATIQGKSFCPAGSGFASVLDVPESVSGCTPTPGFIAGSGVAVVRGAGFVVERDGAFVGRLRIVEVATSLGAAPMRVTLEYAGVGKPSCDVTVCNGM